MMSVDRSRVLRRGVGYVSDLIAKSNEVAGDGGTPFFRWPRQKRHTLKEYRAAQPSGGGASAVCCLLSNERSVGRPTRVEKIE
jgi:hypothetical protein